MLRLLRAKSERNKQSIRNWSPDRDSNTKPLEYEAAGANLLTGWPYESQLPEKKGSWDALTDHTSEENLLL